MRDDLHRTNGKAENPSPSHSSLEGGQRASSLEAAFLSDAAVDECVVLRRDGSRASPEHVAYVVISCGEDVGAVQSRLAQHHAEQISAVVPIVRLPTNGSGDVDVAALSRVPVRGAGVESAWELRAAGLAGVSRAAAVTGIFLRAAPRRHRDDLRSEDVRAPVVADPRVAVSSPATTLSSEGMRNAALLPPALRRGVSLPVSESDAWSIAEALRAAPGDSRIVYVAPDGAERVETYASQMQEAACLVGGLRAFGVAPADTVIFQVDQADDIVPLFWACMLGGFRVVIAPVPVSYDEPSRALTQLSDLFDLFEKKATIVVSRARAEGFHAGVGRSRLAGARVAVMEDLRTASPDRRLHAALPDDVALYALSSGSSAGSKAIALTHRNILARARGVNAQCYSERDVVFNWLPFDHIGSISEGHLRPAIMGCTLVYAPKDYVVGRPLRLLDLIDRHRISHTWAPNFSYALVSSALAREPGGKWDLSCVRMLLNAGELITTAAMDRFVADLAPFGLRRSAVQSAFGMAELCSGVTYHQPAEGESLRFHYVDRASLGGGLRLTHPDDSAAIAFASLGNVIPGVSMRIVDAEGRVVTELTCGRLQFQGDALSPGYYRNAEANRAFGEDGWFDTGDMGFIAEGELVLTGRADTGIVVNGANFSNGEIESLVEEVSGVATSYVAACAVRAREGGTSKLAVFFQPETFDEALLARLLTAIQAHLGKRLGVKADYLLPVVAAAIPKTEIGKIQRKKLTEQFDRGEHDALVRRVDLLLGNQNTFTASYARRTWRQKKLVHGRKQRDGTTLLVVDGDGLSERMANELRQRDLQFVAVAAGDRFSAYHGGARARFEDPGDQRALAGWLIEAKMRVHTVVDLRAAGAPLGDLLRALFPREHAEEVRLIGVVAGEDPSAIVGSGRDRVRSASLLAAAKSDLPSLRCVLVDFQKGELSSSDRIEKIVDEIAGSSADETVVYRSSGRWVIGLASIDATSNASRTLSFVRGGAYVVCGGSRGIGPRMCEAWVDRFGARFVHWNGDGSPFEAGTAPIHGVVHVASDSVDDVNAARDPHALDALLEQRARELGALVAIAREHAEASFVAVSALRDCVAAGPAIAWQNERAFEALRGSDRNVHGVDLAWEVVDRDAIDRVLGAMQLGGHVVVRAHECARDGSEERTKLFVALRDAAALGPNELAFHDAFGNDAGVEIVLMRDPNAQAGVIRHLPLMPLLGEGEVDRTELRRLADEEGAASRPIPASEIETQIVAIWKDVLGVDSINAQDSFFELGGHSLLLVQTHERLTRLFGSRLTMVDLFKYPTVQALAAFLGEGKPEDTAARRGALRAEAREARRASTEAPAIAVIGMACRFPGASDLNTFWENLANGRESIATLTVDELVAAGIEPALVNHPDYVKASPRLAEAEYFDAEVFGYTAREAELMDPQHRLLLECAWEAFEVAGHHPLVHKEPVGVYVGASLNTYFVNNLLPNRATLDASDDLSVMTLDSMGGFQLMVAADKDYLPTRISYKLNLTGPSINVQTACSTGLVAIHLACQAILSGECDAALAGGASIKAPQAVGHLYQEGMIVSPDGHCRAFDRDARGTIFGSGVGVVLLKRLDLALRDRDPIFAVVKGTAVNNDGGFKVGYAAPSGEGQAAVVAEALAIAKVAPETVTFVEAHGTGTEMGDPIEIGGLSDAFRLGTEQRGFCAVGSVKTNVGHLQITSGAAGFIKTALALHHRVIPPTLHYANPNPAIDFANSPFFVNTEALAWNTTEKRRAGVNSLGIGGTNAHAILEEAPPTDVLAASARKTHLLTLSAKSAAGLDALVDRYRQWAQGRSSADIADVCYTTNVGRAHLEHRVALVVDSMSTLETQLRRKPAARGRSTARPKVLFLFTGQGSQSANMAAELFVTEPVFRATLEQCNDLLRGRLEPDLLTVLYGEGEGAGNEGGAVGGATIDRTEWTQPALFAVEYALYQMWRSFGVEPDAVLGHSIGEYVAACVAGVFSLEDALSIVVERARLMGQQPGSGAMAAVFADEGSVAARLARHGDKLSVAAVNGPLHTVISGEADALRAVLADCAREGVSHKVLRVSHAFHSPLMRGAAAAFERFVARFELSPPRIPLLSNVTGALVDKDLIEPSYWSRHMLEPVRFADGVVSARKVGCDHFLEVGPRPSLLSLAATLVEEGAVAMLPSLRSGEDDWRTVVESLGRLYEGGVSVSWEGVHRDVERRRVVLPTYAFQRARYWVDPPAVATSTVGARAPRDPSSLLAKVALSPLIPHMLWQGELSAQRAPFLSDHRVFERIVVSGACYVALVVDIATRHLGATSCELVDVVFSRALPVPESMGVGVQLVLEPQGGDRYAFKFISQNVQGAESFEEHAEGVLVVHKGAAMPSVVDLIALRARCGERLQVGDLYAAQRQRRIELGPSYQWLRALARGKGEAFGEIATPADLAAGFAGKLHPGLIDACFGLLLAGEDLRHGATQVPFRVARIRVHALPEGGPLAAHASIAEGANDGVVGTMRVFDAAGRPTLEVERLEARHVDASAFVATNETTASDIIYDLAWQPEDDAPRESARLAEGTFIVLGGESRTGVELVRRLRAEGRRCYLLSAARDSARDARGEDEVFVDPGDSSGLRKWLGTVESPVAGIVHVEGFSASAPSDEPHDLASAHERGCRSLLDVVQAVRRIGWEPVPALWIATRGAQSLAGGSVHLGQAPLWGLGRVLAVEQPDFACTRIDLDPDGAEDQSNVLFGAIACGPSRAEVAWRQGKRYVQKLGRAKTLSGARITSFDAGGAYLITGGFGALGRRIAVWLADHGARHLVLAGRHVPETPLADMQRLIERGCRVEMKALDVASPLAVSEWVRRLRREGAKLKGVLHLAGTLDDGALLQQNWERFRNVMSSKVSGALNLHHATRQDALDFFICFSSIASVFGSPAQGNYAAANAFLDALCHHRQSQGLPGLSINWGPWAGTGMAASARTRDRERIAAQGILPLEPEPALRGLESIWHDRAAQKVVVNMDWPAFQRSAHSGALPPLLAAFSSRQTNPVRRAFLREELEAAPVETRRRLLQKLVRTEVVNVLGVGTGRTLTDAQGLAEVGLDSLQAIDVKNRLSLAFGVTLPSTLLFDHPSVQALADYLAAKMVELFGAASPSAAGSTSRSLPDPALGDLSERELFDLLAEQLDAPPAPPARGS